MVENPAALAKTQLDINRLKELAKSLGFGGFIGLATGAAIKHTARKVFYVLGMLIILLQTAQYAGFLDVRWDKISEVALPFFDANEDGRLDEDDFTFLVENALQLAPDVLTQGLTNLTGFLTGLIVAFWIF